MPFINMKTNVKADKNICDVIKVDLGVAITSIPGKTEGWLMVGIEDNYTLYFKGSSEPAAMVEVSIYGNASDNAFSILTSHITGIMTNRLGIPSDRVYVKYTCTDNWGWNGSNF